MRQGQVQVNGGQVIHSAEAGVFELQGDGIQLQTATETTLLVLSGEPLHEPVVGHGPFVMNTAQEIRQAMLDYQQGRMGSLR